MMMVWEQERAYWLWRQQMQPLKNAASGYISAVVWNKHKLFAKCYPRPLILFWCRRSPDVLQQHVTVQYKRPLCEEEMGLCDSPGWLQPHTNSAKTCCAEESRATVCVVLHHSPDVTWRNYSTTAVSRTMQNFIFNMDFFFPESCFVYWCQYCRNVK